MVGLSWLFFFKSCEPHRLEAESPFQEHRSTVEINTHTGTGTAAGTLSNTSLRGHLAHNLSWRSFTRGLGRF